MQFPCLKAKRLKLASKLSALNLRIDINSIHKTKMCDIPSANSEKLTHETHHLENCNSTLPGLQIIIQLCFVPKY